MSKVQQKLFGGEAEVSPEPPKKRKGRTVTSSRAQIIDPDLLDKTPSEEYLGRIRDEMYLWDMRCWDERSREEATKWVNELEEGSRENKNCGHATYCISKLLRRGVEKNLIVDAMMSNKKIQYRNRLVRCFGSGWVTDFKNHPCPRAREAGNYTDSHCEDCEDPKDVKRNHAKPKRKIVAKKATGT